MIAVAVTMGVIPVYAAPASAAPPDPIEDSAASMEAWLANADAAAATKAVTTGLPVEVLERATSTDKVVAYPDGSFQLELSATPSRKRLPSGEWAPLSHGLHTLNGRLRPRVSNGDVSFSTGGTAPFAAMHTDAGRFALSWPASLLPPTVSGETATYKNVLPGVDLAVRAVDDGFIHVLVVNSREAADNTALRTFRLGLAGGVVMPRTAADGTVELVDQDGNVVAAGSEALIWDSRADGDSASPGNSEHTAVASVAVSGTDMVVTPDAAYLDAADTVYPVYIDPSYARGYKRWAWTNSRNESNNAEVRIGRRPDTGAIYRSFFTYDVSALRGKVIHAARVLTTVRHSWSCANTPVSLYHVGSHSAGKLSWDGPSLTRLLDTRSGHAHKPSGGTGCGNDPQDDSHLEFAGATRLEVQAAATANATEMAFGFVATSGGSGESTQDRWKKLRGADTKLVVDYNSKPTTPTGASTDGRGCATGTSRPVLSTATPTLRAKVGDPDPETDLIAHVEWQRYDTSVTPAEWRALGSGTQARLRTGGVGAVRIPSGLVHGGIYRWAMRTQDPWRYGSTSGTLSSDFAAFCEFEVDTVNPSAAPGVSSAVYGSDLNLVYGGVGQTAPFTFSPAGVTDIVGYRYGWADPPTAQVTVAVGQNATVRLTPPPPKPDDPTSGGQTHLYVVSVDRSGRLSPSVDYAFNIGSAAPPVDEWRFDDAWGTTEFRNTFGQPAVATGSPLAEMPGLTRSGPGQPAATSTWFDGEDDTAKVYSPRIDTSNSFTVSAWVNADRETGEYRTILSATGTTASAMILGRMPNRSWRFMMAQTDTMNPTLMAFGGSSKVQVGAWTHVAMSYDAGAKVAKLYVSGRLEGSLDIPATFAARMFQIGGSVHNANPNYYKPWSGDIANVRVWNRVLTSTEIAPQAAVLVGRWGLDGDGSDATPYGRTATPSASAGWIDDRRGNPLSAFGGDASAAALRTTGPALNTDQSYTVSAWVKINRVNGRYSWVLGQAGSVREVLSLRYESTKKWQFIVPSADVASPTLYSVRSTADAVAGQWTHLTAVYDAAAGNFRLYVNGVVQGSAVTGRSPASNGVFDIGRQAFPTGEFIDGAIDDVRIYAGAMTPSEVARLAAA